ncbi:MAG: S8 family serine peptidase, partial [Deltaproteobacteria bacterium]|nr:S8 family serine peptidase [Deltaproteobacteria bacterium]
MKKMNLFIFFVFLGFFIFSLKTYSQGVPDRYIVVFHEWVSHPDLHAKRLAQGHGLALGHIYQHALKGFVSTIPMNKLDLVKKDPDVIYVSQDQIVTLVGNDRVRGPGKPGGGQGGTTPQPAQVLPSGINRVNAELSSLAFIDGQDQRVDVDVAVLDTGIDKSHPDLNVVGGINFSTGRPTSFKDGNGHGTHVSGTIGALDNAIGVVGVAPGARLWAVRVLDNNGSGFLSDVIAGIDWVTQRADVIDVANMSLGWTEDSSSPSPV